MSTFAEHPYASFLHTVEKPARYAGGEAGHVRKDWRAVEARVCLAFPDVYDIGMSHLGYKILYKILNDDPRTLAERCYCPWVDMEAELRARGLPLVSLESARPLRDFDVVGLSLQYELTYTNCLTMLDLGGVPLRAADRGEGDPLVLAGGPTATHPEPMAAFFDAFVVGDGEEALRALALEWVAMRAAGVGRAERLRRLARHQGVYVPSLYTVSRDEGSQMLVVDRPEDATIPYPVKRAYVGDLSQYPFPDDSPIGGPEAIFDRMSIEIARGCTEGCRFCQAGMIYRPVRERDPEEIVETVLRAVKKSGFDEVSLTSLSTADYSCVSPLIKKVVEKLAPEHVSLGVSSLRAYGLDDDLLDELRKVRASGLTFAPEAGTQRMRDVINKNVTEEQLLETAQRIFSKGWGKMKLYFMIGLPTETDDDVRGIAQTGARALAVGKRAARGRAEVTVSVSTHVPKPHTPFQWCAMDPAEEVSRKQRLLAAEARAARVDLRTHGVEESVLEGICARGDRSLCDVIEHAWRHGARFDSWAEHLKLEVWQAAFEAFDFDSRPMLGTLPVTAKLPWDHVDVGLEPGFLAKEYRKALKSRLSPPCGKQFGRFVHYTNAEEAEADRRPIICYDCGVACDLDHMRSERLVFLRKMGAERRLPLLVDAPPQAAPPVTAESAADIAPEPAPSIAVESASGDETAAAAPATRPARAKQGSRKPPVRADQGPISRHRFRFEKLGPSALLGHLDLLRAVPRVFRRIGVGMAYSQGFHPKPEMAFSPALSLGVLAVDEYVDVKLVGAHDPAALLDAMNRAAPSGLRFTGATPLGPEDAAITRVVSSARYVLVLARTVLEPLGGERSLAARIDEAMAKSEIRLRREIDGLARFVDVRPFLLGASVGGDEADAVVRYAGLRGDLVAISATVKILGSGGVKASELAEAFTGDAGIEHRAVRAALFGDGAASPLDLVALRRARKGEPRSELVEAAP